MAPADVESGLGGSEQTGAVGAAYPDSENQAPRDQVLIAAIQRYYQWLHGRWPAGKVEPLPVVGEDGSTRVPGLRVVGDLTGVPLLKLAVASGAGAVRAICEEASFQAGRASSALGGDGLDLAIVGGGVAGLAAAIEARRRGLNFVLIEAAEVFSTVVNFPKGKPIYTYPSDLVVEAAPSLTATTKEELLEELRAAAAAHQISAQAGRVTGIRRRRGGLEVELAEGAPVVAARVILAIGRSGSYRRLDVPGEDLDLVSNRLHDPADYADKRVLVVGGGDSALETAIAIAEAGGTVTLAYRGAAWSRPKPENVEGLERLVAEGAQAGHIRPLLGAKVEEIKSDRVRLRDHAGQIEDVPADAVFPMIGREPPLELLRRCGVDIHGETSWRGWLALALFLLSMVALYDWKGFGFLSGQLPALSAAEVFPNDMPQRVAAISDNFATAVADRTTVLGTLVVSMKSRSFWYTLAYTLAIGIFGWLRIRRRRTPYVRLQTTTLFLIQALPLFLLPELVLPWLGYNGVFDSGTGAAIANSLFERYISVEQDLAGQWPDWGHPRAYWRAYGLILAWPLMVYNVFTAQPMVAWLVIGFLQTFVLIPLLVWKWGKGAYCGWICSCGGLAETMGDTERQKMPHGPVWNRLNMIGQVLLWIAFLLLAVRVAGWLGWSWASRHFDLLLEGKNTSGALVNPLAWKWTVDVLLGGILGVGLYFKYSGRVWCRFACPLAALMHVYARFTRFRIFADKKKCISCNVCTSVCHQGIDVMSFANKGLPMSDPQCVRCSACVQSCPTGVLAFGELDGSGVVRLDRLVASAVRAREAQGWTPNG